jgi:O-antigen/teichoic acid export membrane protein
MTFSRRLAFGTTQLTLSYGVVRLLTLVTMPILTTLLNPRAYGVAALVTTVISLVSVFGLAGIEMSYTRAYHSAQPPSGVVVEQFCWRFATIGALLAATFGAIAWLLFNPDSAAQDHSLTILLAFGVLLSVANTMSLMRAQLAGRYRAIAATGIATGIICPMASIGIAAVWRQDSLALLIPLVLGNLIAVLILGVPAIAGLSKPAGLTWQEGASLIKIGIAAVVTAPMYWLLASSDRWFLQYFHGVEAVGIYSVAYSVAIIGAIVNGAAFAVWLPEASREYEQDRERARVTLGRLMSRLMAAMALVWLTVAAAGGDVVRWLTDDRFHGAAEFVPYIAGGVFFYGVSQLAVSGLTLAKQLKWAALCWVVGGLASALLNYVFVPAYGGVGAAMTQSASFGLISFALLATSQWKYRIKLEWGRLALITAIVLGAGASLAPAWSRVAPFSLLMKLPFGMVVAAIVFWIAAPDWSLRALNYLRYPRRDSPGLS